MRHLLLCVLFAVLTGCGGGGGSDSAPAPVGPPAPRGELLVGYFGDCDGCIAETRSSTNIAHVMGWGADGAALRHAAEAVGAGQQIMLGVCWFCPDGDMEGQFQQLRQLGLLSRVTVLYPTDEPDVQGMSDLDVAAMLARVRLAAFGFTELHGVRYAVIYGNTGRTPGIGLFDLVGLDHYGHGIAPAQAFLPKLHPGQQLIVPIGGGDPWREDPTSAVAYAMSEPRVGMLVWFIYEYPQLNQPRGVRANGMRAAYCVAGSNALARTPAC